VARGIAGTEIEGGFEWDAWHTAFSDEEHGKPVHFRLHTMQDWPARSAHALSFSPLSGTVTEDSERYALWLRPGAWKIHLVRLAEAGAVRP
jgi:hypothetical protein